MFINRDWNLSEEDDFNKNISVLVSSDAIIKKTCAATPIYDTNMQVVGWQIKPMYE